MKQIKTASQADWEVIRATAEVLRQSICERLDGHIAEVLMRALRSIPTEAKMYDLAQQPPEALRRELDMARRMRSWGKLEILQDIVDAL